MRRWRRIAVRLGSLFAAARREREWKAEFESHVEMHIEDNLRAGMSAEEARRRALVGFGGVESVKDSMRDRAGFLWLDIALRDIRYAFRGLRRSPSFAFSTIVSLSLGLGASLAVFTVADNLLIRPLPYHDASRLTMIWENRGGDGHNVVSPANYLDWKSQNEIHVDFRIVVLAIALSLLTGILFGMAPVLATMRIDLVSAMRGNDRSGLGAGGHLRSWLVGVEVASSVILLCGAILLFRSMVHLETIDPGLDPSHLLSFRVPLTAGRYREARARTQFFERALDQIGQIPAVHSVSAVSFLPFTGSGASTSVNIEGRLPSKPGAELDAIIQTVMPGYFHTLGIPFRSGRDFTVSDNLPESPYRFIVNEAFVRQFLSGVQPLGARINAIMDTENPYGEIIGVVADVRESSIDHEPEPTVYYPHAHLSYPRMVFLVRVDGSPLGLAEPARRAIRQLDSEQPIAEVQTLEDVLGENFSRQRFSSWLLAGFAIVALVLAAVGIYGLLAYSVAARTREFGVRSALGAGPKRIVALVLTSCIGPVLGGLAAGCAGALSLSGLLKSLLFGVGPHDPLTLAGVPLLFAAVAMVAAYLPARKAALIDPMDALRIE